MRCHHSQTLEENFKKSGGSFKEFKISDLFDVKTSKGIDKNKVVFSKTGLYDFIGRTPLNNGIQGKVNKFNYEPNNEDTFSLIQVGESVCLFRENKWYSSQNIFKLTPLNNNITKNHLFFSTVINKSLLTYKQAYTYPTLETVKTLTITLPIIKNGDIAYSYMQERIRELEQERIRELDAYLKTSGLLDYTLTKQDEQILSCKKEYKEFYIGELFISQTGDVDLQQSDINGKGEYFINSGLENNGIKGKTDKEARIFNENTITIDFWGNSFYRNFKYKMATHNHVFSLSSKNIKNENIGLYFVSSMRFLRKLFSYNEMGTWNKIKNISLSLPITTSGEIDYDYIEKYIKALKKTVIKGVNLWREKQIEVTKSVI